MAYLSNTTYNRIAKTPERAKLILINSKGESSTAGALIKLTKTKGKIHTRWETLESKNIHPFTHVALVINNVSQVISGIKPIQNAEFGFIDIDYEGDNE